MAKILTEQEVYNIGGKGSPTANLCCTYARAQVLGCTANGVSLASNQLVYEGSVKAAATTCTYTITSGPYSDEADCEGSTSTGFYYNVTGVVTASNQYGWYQVM